MTRRRFYVPRDLIQENRATLPPTQAHHLRDVLRLRSGDIVEIFDGAGSGYSGEVELVGSEVLIRDLNIISSSESPFQLTLAAALIKPTKFEWMLEKSTELGVDEIIPLKTGHSDIRIPTDKIEFRLERWRRIVRETCRQSARFTEPRVHAPLDFELFLASPDFSDCTKTLFYEKSDQPWHSNAFVSDRIVLCVGPEGGWEPSEVEHAREAGFQIRGLGPRILRAETAAVAAVAVIQHQIRLLTSNY